MFGVGGNGEGRLKGCVEEAEGAVTARGQEVCGVRFRVGEVVEGILGWIPVEDGRISRKSDTISDMWYLPLDRSYSLRRQLQHVESSISDETKIGRCCYRNAVIEERRVLDSVALKAFRPILEHRRCGDVVLLSCSAASTPIRDEAWSNRESLRSDEQNIGVLSIIHIVECLCLLIEICCNEDSVFWCRGLLSWS
jgi:hypothetical protein